MLVEAGNIVVAKRDLPGGGLLAPRDQIHRGGFAGAVRSNQAAQRLFDDLDTEIVDDGNGVETLAEMLDLEKAHRSVPYSPGCG
jgi:hypothetical protein